MSLLHIAISFGAGVLAGIGLVFTVAIAVDFFFDEILDRRR